MMKTLARQALEKVFRTLRESDNYCMVTEGGLVLVIAEGKAGKDLESKVGEMMDEDEAERVAKSG